MRSQYSAFKIRVSLDTSESDHRESTIPLVAKITASFDLLRKDERLVDTSEEYGLTLRPTHTIAELRSALQEPSVNDALESYVLVRSGGEWPTQFGSSVVSPGGNGNFHL